MARLHTRFADDLHPEDTGPIARLRPRSCSQVIPLTDHFVPAHRYLLRISVYSLIVAAVVLAVHTYDNLRQPSTTMTTLDKFKISALSWNGDEALEKYVSWDEQMSSLVRATADGIPLEDFYCTKVGKPLMQQVAVPSYLMNDPDFDGATPFGFGSAPPEESAETDDKSVTVQSATSGLTGTTANSLHTSSTKYMDLPEASRRLDALLYNVLIMNVK